MFSTEFLILSKLIDCVKNNQMNQSLVFGANKQNEKVINYLFRY